MWDQSIAMNTWSQIYASIQDQKYGKEYTEIKVAIYVGSKAWHLRRQISICKWDQSIAMKTLLYIYRIQKHGNEQTEIYRVKKAWQHIDLYGSSRGWY